MGGIGQGASLEHGFLVCGGGVWSYPDGLVLILGTDTWPAASDISG